MLGSLFGKDTKRKIPGPEPVLNRVYESQKDVPRAWQAFWDAARSYVTKAGIRGRAKSAAFTLIEESLVRLQM